MQIVYILDIKDIAAKYEQVLKALPLSAKQKAEEFKEKDDKLRSLCGALLVEAFTAKSPLFYNEWGKPYKNEPPYFNISHSENKVGIFLSDSDSVGFDIQYIKEYNEKLKDYVFSGEEKAGIKDGLGFAVRWAMKEAAAKCVGTGLRSVKTQTLTNISADNFIFGGEKLYYKNYFDGEYAFTACSPKAVNAEFLQINATFALKTLAKRG